MYFFYAVYIVATALVLVQGQEVNHKEPDRPHEYTVLVNGSCKNWKKDYMLSRRNAAVQPLERQVILNPEKDLEFNPKTVSVKRCIGSCMGRHVPMPTKMEPKSSVVQLYRRGEVMPISCVSVTVMEHTKCECMCMKDASSCPETKKWDQSKCSCDCKEPRPQGSSGRPWSYEECSFQCLNKTPCVNHMRWDDNTCKCIRT